MSVNDCAIIQLPRIEDHRGNLTFIEGSDHVEFDLKRVFYLYDVPGGSYRAGHALKTCHQFLIAISGSFDVILRDDTRETRHMLNRSYYGLHIKPMVWRELSNFSSGAVCLVLASERYDEADYIRDFESYKSAMST